MNHKELTWQELQIDPVLPEDISKDYSNNDWGVIGQPRAVEALEMGLSIHGKGYNLFVTGESGTGRNTAVMEILKKFRKKDRPLEDLVYVYNFEENKNPKILILPEGKAEAFRDQMSHFIQKIQGLMAEKLNSPAYKEKRDHLIQETELRENQRLNQFEKELEERNFCLVQLEEDEETTTDILPIFKEEPASFEELHDQISQGELTEAQWSELREEYFHLMDRMKGIYQELKDHRQQLDSKLDELRSSLVGPSLSRELNLIREDWEQPTLLSWLSSLEKDIQQNLDIFTSEDSEEGPEEAELLRYSVNILVNNRHSKELPVIRETNPTRTNLFGSIEARYEVTGECQTNFTMIQAGSLLKANGGFLILRAADLLAQENIWGELKRTIETGTVELEIQSSPLGGPAVIMKPEPVPFQTKIIILGPERLYDTLSTIDSDFRKLFKVSAEFNSWMPYNDNTLKEYLRFILSYQEKYNLMPLSKEGLKEVIRQGISMADRRDQLSTSFSQISDLLRESDYWAQKKEESEISQESVLKAVKVRHRMFNLPEDELLDQIAKGHLLLELQGKAQGTVNGLAVLERGAVFSFGCPMRITASVGAGKEGIINIEREAGLSGEIHSKGVLILEGYLRNRFARHMPLSLFASICVEQNYYEIEGDSASSAELYALLSAIGQIPLRQDLAVTGSVNQFGHIQPVGGVTQKVEGFFKICKIKGLSGSQGVIIPAQNVDNLILSHEILDAIKEGKFHIYPVESIDQGMELLSEKAMGDSSARGKKNKESLFYQISNELINLVRNS